MCLFCLLWLFGGKVRGQTQLSLGTGGAIRDRFTDSAPDEVDHYAASPSVLLHEITEVPETTERGKSRWWRWRSYTRYELKLNRIRMKSGQMLTLRSPRVCVFDYHRRAFDLLCDIWPHPGTTNTNTLAPWPAAGRITITQTLPFSSAPFRGGDCSSRRLFGLLSALRPVDACQ